MPFSRLDIHANKIYIISDIAMHFLFLVFCFTKKLQFSDGMHCLVLLFCFIKNLQHSDGVAKC